MVKNWATRSVSIATFVLRSAIDLQATIAVGMLAALSLESYGALLSDAAWLSVLRCCIATPSNILLPSFRGVRWGSPALYFAMSAGLFATTWLLQLSSTALLSDLQLGELPGQVNQSRISYDFFYNVTKSGRQTNSTLPAPEFPYVARSSAWLQNPLSYPTFAEYAEPVKQVDGVSDTGVLLRAFLPFAQAQTRQSLRNYTGKALVLDSRVSCHLPKFDDPSKILKQILSSYDPGIAGNISGTVRTEKYTSRSLVPEEGAPFLCFLDGAYSICQVNPTLMNVPSSPYKFGLGNDFVYSSSNHLGGGLLSEFWAADEIQNSSTRYPAIWNVAHLVSAVRILNDTSEAVATNIEPHGEWLEMTLNSTKGALWRKVISFTLCYSAWDTARLPVDMYSDVSSVEPSVYWPPAAIKAASSYESQTSFLTAENSLRTASWVPSFQSILKQLGQPTQIGQPARTYTERRIMNLAKRQSWIPDDTDRVAQGAAPFVQADGNSVNSIITTRNAVPTITGNKTIFPTLQGLNQTVYYGAGAGVWFKSNNDVPWTVADPSIGNLFIENMMHTNGNAAASLSSLITVLSSQAYYDQFPQYTTADVATLSFFETVLYPQSTRGFIGLVVVLAFHLILIAAVSILFLTQARLTKLGNFWQAITQLSGTEIDEAFSTESMANESKVDETLQKKSRSSFRVGLAEIRDDSLDRTVRLRKRPEN
ncbi:MAG: hypothetical protein Q9227_001259 [Pyrenula ochraceoflavens]